MQNLVVVGISHNTAPVNVREKVAFAEAELQPALGQLLQRTGLEEGMILSTCNRVEVVGRGSTSVDSSVVQGFFCEFHKLESQFLDEHLYAHTEAQAVRHLFRVAGSLDSMVVGEPQILFQLKDAYRTAVDAGTIGRHLHHLLSRAFFVAKRIRTETKVAVSAVSVSSVAVELARKIFADLSKKTILMLGAGKMGELAGRNLLESGVAQVLVTNRTPDKAEALARKYSGRAVPFEERDQYLAQADIVLVSTGAREYLLDRNLLEPVMHKRRSRPLFIIDISVPRNVDPLTNQMANVFLYDIDDLQSVVEENLEDRRKEADFAEGIVEEEVVKFSRRLTSIQTGPVISRLRKKVEELCLEELETNRNGFSREQTEQLERLLLRVAHRVAHPLIIKLKDSEQPARERLHNLELMKQIFSLDDDHD